MTNENLFPINAISSQNVYYGLNSQRTFSLQIISYLSMQLSSEKKRKLMFVSLSLLNIPEYSWIFLYEQDSEYTSGPKYAKILNDGFSTCKRYTAIWINQNMLWQSSEYFLGYKYVRNLNMQELHRVLNMPQYGWRCLNRTSKNQRRSKKVIVNNCSF